ncbi:MAG TPA: PaaI family thioesterase [Cytophagaceae bacterium]|jgi:acyl-coenzyme A thioesterase 13|nr:PaaI family thioesterase [Cytophagaceae bacterium]HSZ85722.1 PaaI family thioesterase [Puia sp.]
MEENKVIKVLKQHIGKIFENNPSHYGVWLGGILVEVEEGRLTAEYTVREEMINAIGTLHGGIIAGILDDMMGTVVVSLGSKHFYTTVNLNVDYFYPARAGEVVTAKAFLVKTGKMIHHAQAELWNLSTNKLLAKGTSNLLKIDTEVKHHDR